MENNRIIFSDLPNGQQSTLIILASINGKAVYYIENIITSAQDIKNIKFLPITPQQFREVMMQLESAKR